MAPLHHTCAVMLRLATVSALINGLDMLGFRWTPQPIDNVADLAPYSLLRQPGLYAWTGRGIDQPETDGWRQAGVLYVGIGDGSGGVHGRVSDEIGWSSAEAEHFHGRATALLGAAPVGGPVHRVAVSLDWLSDWIPKSGRCDHDRLRSTEPLATTTKWLESTATPLRAAESIAIRLAGHLGHVAPPLNSRHTSAWADYSPADWAATAVTKRLAREDRLPLST